jgi:hypothetical protein
VTTGPAAETPGRLDVLSHLDGSPLTDGCASARPHGRPPGGRRDRPGPHVSAPAPQPHGRPCGGRPEEPSAARQAASGHDVEQSRPTRRGVRSTSLVADWVPWLEVARRVLAAIPAIAGWVVDPRGVVPGDRASPSPADTQPEARATTASPGARAGSQATLVARVVGEGARADLRTGLATKSASGIAGATRPGPLDPDQGCPAAPDRHVAYSHGRANALSGDGSTAATPRPCRSWSPQPARGRRGAHRPNQPEPFETKAPPAPRSRAQQYPSPALGLPPKCPDTTNSEAPGPRSGRG